jgi:hypothetical protein
VREVTISDWPFSVSMHHLLYSKMLRECPSIFSAEGDVTLPDSCLDTTLFVPSVQNRCGIGGIISSFQEMMLLTFSPTCICPLGKIPIFPHFHNKLECLSLNIRLGWKGLPGTNIMAYYGNRKLRS